MRVVINRGVCNAQLAFCEQCLGRFLREPYGYERQCFEEIIEDDGNKEILTVELYSPEIEEPVILEMDEEMRKKAAGEGWSYFVNFEPNMYRGEKEPHKKVE